MIPPKRFDIFAPDWGMLRRSIRSDFSLNNNNQSVLLLTSGGAQKIEMHPDISTNNLSLP